MKLNELDFKKIFYIFFFLTLLLIIGFIFNYFLNLFLDIEPLWAVVVQDYYRVSKGSTVSINKWGICRRVTNNCTYDIFVPVKTSGEWNAFINYKPTCVSLANCSWVCPGSGGYLNCTFEAVYSYNGCSGTLLGYRFYSAPCSNNGSRTCYRIYGSSYARVGNSRYIYGNSSCYYGFSGCYNARYNYQLLPYVSTCTWQ